MWEFRSRNQCDHKRKVVTSQSVSSARCNLAFLTYYIYKQLL